MTDAPDPARSWPPIGSPFFMPVIQSATRTLLMAEMATVASAPDGNLEIVLLRRELQVVMQNGTIAGHEADGPTVNIDGYQLQVVPMDIGHVRIDASAAIDLAASILQHVVTARGVERSEVLERLQKANVVVR